MIENTITAMPAGGLATGSGEISRRIASAISRTALPTRKADCPRAASGSALPWPKRCSRSAGTVACRTAEKITSEAAGSTIAPRRVREGLSAGSGIEALLAPGVALAGEEDAVVQPERPLLPELDAVRLHA